jgi:integrase
MKFNLTDEFIENFQPSAKRQIIYDSEALGLALFITGRFTNNKGEISGGHKSFYFTYSSSGNKRQLHLGAYPDLSLLEARLKAAEMRNLVVKGFEPLIDDKRADSVLLTVDECFDKFFDAHIYAHLKKLTSVSYESLFKQHISPTIGSRIIGSVTKQDLEKLHLDLIHIPTAANRVLAVCSSFFNWCEREGLRVKGSDLTKGIVRHKETPILKFLNLPQLQELWDAIDRLENSQKLHLYPATALKLLIMTGARKNEILGLKWTDFNQDQSSAALTDTKTGFKTLNFPVKARQILQALPRESEYLFPSRSSTGHLFNLQWQWKQVLREAKLVDRWRIHDLRHGFASVAVNLGGSLSFIGFLLGHKKASTTEKYAHVAQHPALGLLNDVVDAIVPDDSTTDK